MQTKGRETEAVGPGPGLSWWLPLIGWYAGVNANLQQTALAIGNEWQSFVGRRIAEDLRTFQQFSAAKSPQQLWVISARFWQRAIEDYAREHAVIGKLANSGISRGIAAAEEATQANAQTDAPLSKAA